MLVPSDTAVASAVKTLWAKSWPAEVATRSGPNDRGARLFGADNEIVKVATHLESARLFDPADLHRLEARGSDQPLDFVAGAVVVGHVDRTAGSGDGLLEDSKRSADMVPNAMASCAPVGDNPATSPDDWPTGRISHCARTMAVSGSRYSRLGSVPPESARLLSWWGRSVVFLGERVACRT